MSLPGALARKYPEASCQWGWQYLFPSTTLCADLLDGRPVRHHLHDKSVQRTVQVAVRKAGLTQPTCWGRARRG